MWCTKPQILDNMPQATESKTFLRYGVSILLVQKVLHFQGYKKYTAFSWMFQTYIIVIIIIIVQYNKKVVTYNHTWCLLLVHMVSLYNTHPGRIWNILQQNKCPVLLQVLNISQLEGDTICRQPYLNPRWLTVGQRITWIGNTSLSMIPWYQLDHLSKVKMVVKAWCSHKLFSPNGHSTAGVMFSPWKK